MNALSSRSHAVFTVTIDVLYNADTSKAGRGEDTTRDMRAKLHLVDLAGIQQFPHLSMYIIYHSGLQ